MKKAIISGISGQDASYLAELLLEKDYEVFGISRRVAVENDMYRYSRINHIKDKIKIYSGDIRDYSIMYQIINEVRPDEFYHLAAQSFVKVSFQDEYTILDGNIKGTVNILNILRDIKSDCKFYHASSSEQFGRVLEVPQTEKTPFNPRSPYGIGKCSTHYWTKLYREAYDMFCCNGILFNHESERRGLEFVTRKISRAVANIKLGNQKVLELGNLDAKRDWGHSKDFCEAMWLMLQQDKPDDYVIATGETHSIREFLEIAFTHVGLLYEDYVKINPEFYRPAEVDLLVGDAAKANWRLDWKPKIRFEDLVKLMVDNDLQQLQARDYNF
jgi:GDPmannose 4,6-dehydratase